MVNTILFGVGAGLVIFLWIEYSQGSPFLQFHDGSFLTLEQRLLLATGAVMFAGFCHSLLILQSNIKGRQKYNLISKAQNSDPENLAMLDPLTRINNRRYFDGILDAFVGEFRDLDSTFGVILLALDDFDSINDTYGENAGFSVLYQVAQRMKNNAREYDTVARISSDEFAVIAPIVNQQQLSSIAERYRADMFNLEIEYGVVKVPVSSSIGIAIFENEFSASDLFFKVEQNLRDSPGKSSNSIAA